MSRKVIIRSIVPNLLTLANVFCGFVSIVYTSNGKFTYAAIFILLGAIFDLFDGLVARLIHASSEFGVELDSLCDAVTFGVAPSFILYKSFFYQHGDWGILLSSLPALAGIVRLARFNVNLTSLEEKGAFTGLPIPSAALTLVSFNIFYLFPNDYVTVNAFAAVSSIVVLTSLAMVSTIKYDSLPKPNLRNIKERPFLFLFLLTGIAGTLITKGYFLFPFMLVYIAYGAIRHCIQWIITKQNPEDEFDDDDPDDYFGEMNE